MTVKRVLVTGGSGFIGAWTVRRLIGRGVDVRVFDVSADRSRCAAIVGADLARNVDWVVGDVSNAADVMQAAQGCDAVVHLAAILTPGCIRDPVRGAAINYIGTLNVFEAALEHGFASVVYASSAAVFGPDDAQTPNPVSQYGAHKLACEGSARAYWIDRGLPSIAFRPFVVYGPGRETGLSAGPSLACRAAARGEAYDHPFTGSFGAMFVDDAAQAFEWSVFKKAEGAAAVNLVGEPSSVDQILDEIRRQVPGARLSQSGPPLPIASNVRQDGLDALLPGRQVTRLEDGIARTIAFYRD